ncbi:PAAR domain-containing protein [Lonsdalea quercina]|uniref:PAAR domain-containing protein n=1 Tax=Lonsdalea quercina TaxID=71657 RepID=UPI003974D738
MAAEGFYLVQGDKTTCGGVIITGAEDHTLFDKPVAREQDSVTCGQHAGLYKIAGGIDNDTIHDRRMAGTLDSYSTCPCKAKFIPSMMDDTYEKSSGASAGESAAGFTAAPAQTFELPGYLTGEQKPTRFVPDYPVLINTHHLPDDKLRAMLEANRQYCMILTLPECLEIITSWDFVKHTWTSITTSTPGNIVKTYWTNINDVISASKIVGQLGAMGIKGTVFINHKGTELIKLTGYPGIRKALNAPVFSLKHPKIIEMAIGKYGLAKTVVDGTIVGLIYVSAVDTIDFFLNDETSLAEFMGTLATDVVKVGLSSAVIWGTGYAVNAFLPFVLGPLAVVVFAGVGTAIILNALDKEYGITDKLVAYIESAQQEFVDKARGLERGVWDLGAMYVDGMLDKGRKVIEAEVERYIRNAIRDVGLRRLE